MTSYREILRLSAQGISQRSIARSCDCSRNTVARVVGVNYFCRLATIIFAGSPLSFFGRSCCRDYVAGLLRCGSWAH
jgi:hypothetical protein